MREFKDSQNRTIQVAVNVAVVKAVRSALNIDLIAGALDGSIYQKLIEDPVLLVDVLYVACREDLDRLQIDDLAFGRAMAGDAIANATQAFLEELGDFFPATRRALLQKALTKLQAMDRKVVERAEAIIDSPELDRQIDELLERLGTSSGNAPALSASSPTA